MQNGVKNALELRDVWRSYVEGAGEHPVLAGASATVPAGEFCVVVGKSGSGKSTLLNLVSGIDLPDRGAILVAGRSIGELSEQERTLFRRRRIGFVFQAFHLIPTLSVEENLRLPLELNGMGSRHDQRQRASEILAAVGLAGLEKRFADQLSGGEQQRVAVARALIHDPEIILADEPTGNLDLETGGQVLDLLDRLTRGAGKTLVIATHSTDVLGRADRVLSIVNGQIETNQIETDQIEIGRSEPRPS